MKIQVLDRGKKKKFLRELEGFGVKWVPELLVRSGKERIRAFSGDLSREEIMEIWRLFPIEGVGLYVGKDMMNRNGIHEVRLSVDGMHIWKEQLTDGIFVLTEEQEVDWFAGKDVALGDVDIKNGFVLVKSADEKDFVGFGKIGNDRKTLFGYLPKERRRKERL